MVAKTDKSKELEKALAEALELKEEYHSLDSRSNEIGRDIERLTREMGEARLARKNTLGIHKQISELEQEHRELLATLRAMAPLMQEAERVIKWATEERYRDEYQAANEQAGMLAGEIIQLLDAVHCQLVQLHKLQHTMQVASSYTGKSVQLPGPSITLQAEQVWPLVNQALSLIVQSNGLERGPALFKQLQVGTDGQRASEYNGNREVLR